MNSFYSDIIKLIKSALDDEGCKLSNEFNIGEVYKLAKRHRITTLLYCGALKCGIASKHPVMQEMLFNVAKDIQINEIQKNEINKIFEVFDNHRIDYMPLKGVLLKKMYPKPEMRPMGDVDILINTEQYEQIKPIMLSLGYSEKIESDHELIWIKSGMYVELHKRLIPSYNKDFYEYFGDGWKFAEKCDGTCYSMTTENQFIYLFTHFAKHYRDAGIGIRHIVDLWVYRKCYPEMDENYVKVRLKYFHLDVFYENILKTLSVWFDGAQEDKITDFITSIILNNGVYGNKQASILANALKESKKTGNLRNVRGKRILDNVFPPYRVMCEKFPILKKYSILLPIFWIVRIVNVFLFKQTQIRKKIREYKTISAEQIASYKVGLNFVGLDFNFKE